LATCTPQNIRKRRKRQRRRHDSKVSSLPKHPAAKWRGGCCALSGRRVGKAFGFGLINSRSIDEKEGEGERKKQKEVFPCSLESASAVLSNREGVTKRKGEKERADKMISRNFRRKRIKSSAGKPPRYANNFTHVPFGSKKGNERADQTRIHIEGKEGNEGPIQEIAARDPNRTASHNPKEGDTQK